MWHEASWQTVVGWASLLLPEPRVGRLRFCGFRRSWNYFWFILLKLLFVVKLVFIVKLLFVIKLVFVVKLFIL